MFSLMVSYNCGISYWPEHKAETVDELRPRMKELDEQWLRWYVGKDDGEFVDISCAIHSGLLEFIELIAAAQPQHEPDRSAHNSQGNPK